MAIWLQKFKLSPRLKAPGEGAFLHWEILASKQFGGVTLKYMLTSLIVAFPDCGQLGFLVQRLFYSIFLQVTFCQEYYGFYIEQSIMIPT